MTKVLTLCSVGLVVLMTMFSCKDDVDAQFLNPETTTNVSIPAFFTNMLDNGRIRPAYTNVRTFLLEHTAKYTQTVGYIQESSRFSQQLTYTDSYWKSYYLSIVANMREIERAYGAMSDEDKETVDVAVMAAYVALYEQTATMVDMWGDIPFSEAGSINATAGTYTAAKFDDAVEIYNTIIVGLEEAAAFFASSSITGSESATFSTQDILFSGDLTMWQRYANSLRLRALMRISNFDETTAKTEVMEMLNNPAAYPLIDDDDYNAIIAPATTYSTTAVKTALNEKVAYSAPQYMLEEVLQPANDPRIRVLFDKNGKDDYYALPRGTSVTSSGQLSAVNNDDYACFDSVTYLNNYSLPGVFITSSEVQFLKAEAYQRWGATDDAQTAYEAGVTDAVEFLFYLNELGANASGEDGEDVLTDTEMSDLLASSTVAYSGTDEEKLEKIFTQKWLSFGFLQSIQGWAEYRRSGYPKLTFFEDSDPDYPLPSTRLIYPTTEITYNEDNYAAVADEDNPYNTVFWDVD